jgi:hypothetical protein
MQRREIGLEVLSPEEFQARAEERNALATEPTDRIDHKVEEFCKAARGIPTPRRPH